jgi:hypothetical protein
MVGAGSAAAGTLCVNPTEGYAMRNSPIWFAFVTGLGLLSGCGGGDVPLTGVIVRDSAGIRILESPGNTRFPAPWVLGETPEWIIGELEGDPEYLLSRVVGAMTLPGAEVVIGDGDLNELRFYNQHGKWTRTLGGTGEGPGEFEYLRGLGRCHPDGFVAFDMHWQRNAYLMDGTFVDKTVMKLPSGVTPYNLACDEDGNFLILGWGRAVGSGPIIGFFQTHDRLLLASDDGVVKTDFGERLVSERIGTEGGSRPHPAGRATRFVLEDDQAFVGSGEEFQVEVWDLSGTLRTLLRGPNLRLEVTDSVKEEFLRGRLAQASESQHAALRSSLADWEWPDRLPAFTDLKVGPMGIVWAKRYSPNPDAPETWSLIDPEKAYLGDLELGPRRSLLDVGLDHVLVLSRDALDVERVERVPLDRGSDS